MSAVAEQSTSQPASEKQLSENNGSSGEEQASWWEESSVGEKKAVVADFEHQLREKHGDKYSRFQIKIWAEVLANGQYSDLDTHTPPGYAICLVQKNRD